MTRYEVEYYYYQYNSGLADNGYKKERYDCITLNEAVNIVNEIKHAIDCHQNDINSAQADITKTKLIGWSGYFSREPIVFEITERKLELVGQGNSID